MSHSIIIPGKAIEPIIVDIKDRAQLRAWWHDLQRSEGHYSCYAIFLLLPSDTEAIRYLVDFGQELDVISGNNCLVIALSRHNFKRSKIDDHISVANDDVAKRTKAIREMMESHIPVWRNDDKNKDAKARRKTRDNSRTKKVPVWRWEDAINEQAQKGYSVEVAKLFNIKLDEFPCLVIFQDIRSPAHITITLKEMNTKEIIQRMRTIFSVIQDAIEKGTNPLRAIRDQKHNEMLLRDGKAIVGKLRSVAGKTFETAMDIWIKAKMGTG
jgi:hypothetical protein